MVNPNTKEFDHFTDEAFYYGWCENCGLGVALTDNAELDRVFKITDGILRSIIVAVEA